MSRYFSPLRYPGGKTRLYPFLEALLRKASLFDLDYVEPYAGGAGAGLALLFHEAVSTVHINDVSPSIKAFWSAVTLHNNEFCERIRSAKLTVKEWRRQKRLLRVPAGISVLDRGFAAFYLNRTNRSGIVDSGGVIGGVDQAGRWKMDARFNREELARRVRRLGLYAGRIHVSGQDALELLREPCPSAARTFYYLDPPYYHRAERLYQHWYVHSDHVAVADIVRRLQSPWIVSYDDCPEIRDIYSGIPSAKLNLAYSAARSYTGSEIVFVSEHFAEYLEQVVAVSDQGVFGRTPGI